MNTKKYTIFITSLWVILMIPSGYYFSKQSHENNLINAYLEKTKIIESDSVWENAKKLSQTLRSEFETDQKKFVVLKMSNRPFLRESSAELLSIKEGQCGEGTRVLVNLLLAYGYDATRISLYDKYLNASHTLVSLQTGGQEYLIDSINTSKSVNDFINNKQINSDSFKIVKYSDDVIERKTDLQTLRSLDIEFQAIKTENIDDRFYNRFKYFSYEALPFTKLFSAVGLDVRILNFDRPPRFLSSLAEKPFLILSIFWAIVATLLTSILFLIRVVKGFLSNRAH